MISIQRLKRNVISNVLGTIVPALAWFFVVPVLVLMLGDQGYGIYTIAISFAGVLGVLELGLTSASTKFIAEVEVRNDRKKLEKIIANNLFVYVGMGLILIAISFAFSSSIGPLLLPDSGLPQGEIETIVQLIGIVLFLVLIKNTFSSVLMGLHRYDIYNIIQIGYAILMAAAQILIALNNGGVVALMVGNIVVNILSLIAFIIVILQQVPGIRLLAWPDGYYLKILFSFGLYMMLINLAGSVLFNVDKVLVGQVLGPASVSYYSVPSQLTLKIHNGLAVFISFLFPMVSEAQSLGDNETLEKVFIQGMRFITLIDGSVLVFIAVFSQQILGLWINPDFASQSWFLLILTAMGYIFYALSITPYHILLGMGRPKMLAVFNLVTTLSVILGLYIGVTWFGLVGGCVGAMLGFLTAAIMPIYVQNVLRISWTKAFNQSYGRTVLITTGAAFLSMLLPHFIEIRIVFFAVFIVTLILLGNIQPEDWKLLQRQWKQTTTQIVILRDQIAHRN